MSDRLRPLLVFTALVGSIVAVVLLYQWFEAGRPVLLEVRVVTATDDDPVHRDGVRRLAPQERYTTTVALLVDQRGRERSWISPAERLAVDGRPVEHRRVDAWPEDDRTARVMWMTVEPARLGGERTAPRRDPDLQIETFAAPEMGRGLVAEAMAEPHNDDYMPDEDQPDARGPGTIRLAARVEIVAQPTDLTPLQVVTSPEADGVRDGRVTTVSRAVQLPAPLDPSVGELFWLPSFELPDTTDPPQRDDPVTALAGLRLACSSPTLAAVAVSGEPVLAADRLQRVGTLSFASDVLRMNGRAPLWGTMARTGDLLRHDGHWIVLVEDTDGDGRLGLDDPVLHSWGRPAELVPLSQTLPTTETTVELLRYGR